MKTFQVGNYEIGSGKLTLLSGPCVIESKELCLEIAGVLKELCAKRGINYIFKSSFDKANRSSADSFRGMGMDAGLEV